MFGFFFLTFSRSRRKTKRPNETSRAVENRKSEHLFRFCFQQSDILSSFNGNRRVHAIGKEHSEKKNNTHISYTENEIGENMNSPRFYPIQPCNNSSNDLKTVNKRCLITNKSQNNNIACTCCMYII